MKSCRIVIKGKLLNLKDETSSHKMSKCKIACHASNAELIFYQKICCPCLYAEAVHICYRISIFKV